MHPLLRRQLRRAGVDDTAAPDAWRILLERVSQCFAEADQERYRLERSITICSEEMSELNENLASERDLFRTIFESAAVGIVRTSIDGVILGCNDAYAAMLGYPVAELVGKRGLDFVHVDERDQALAMLNSADHDVPAPSYERRLVHRDGSPVFATIHRSVVRDAEGRPLFVIAVVRDTTREKHLEVELRQAQKLESVGRLAAGIAHEINTPVQFVSDNIQFVGGALNDLLELLRGYRSLRETASAAFPEHASRLEGAERATDLGFLAEEAPAAVERALEGLQRVAGIVLGMKTFVQADRPHKSATDLNQAIETTLVITRNEYKYVADVETDFGPLPPVVCNAREVNQVFLHIVMNAAHAIRDVVADTASRGCIRIRTWHEAGSAFVSVSDTGGGIPDGIRDRIFEPFFTTKDVGRGTGQGLAIARAVVVERHHGELTFETEIGRGTTFVIRLPVVPPARVAPPNAPVSEQRRRDIVEIDDTPAGCQA